MQMEIPQPVREFTNAGKHHVFVFHLKLSHDKPHVLPVRTHIPSEYWETFVNASLSDHLIHIVHQNIPFLIKSASKLDPSSASEAHVAATFAKSNKIFKSGIGKGQTKKQIALKMFKSQLIKFTYHLEPTRPSYHSFEFSAISEKSIETTHFHTSNTTLVLHAVPAHISSSKLPLASKDTSITQFLK